MPAVAVVAAGFSISAGVTALGVATTLGASLAAGASIVGGVLGGLGAITGNKKLTRIGSVLGIAGAVGTGFAQSAAESASSDALGGFISDNADKIAGADAVTAGLEGASGEVASESATLGLGGATELAGAAETAGLSSDTGLLDLAKTSVERPGIASVSLGDKPGIIDKLKSEAGLLFEGNKVTDPFGQVAAGSGSSSGGLLSDAISAVKKNPELAKVVAGMVSGGGKYLSERQALKEKERLTTQARDRYNQSILGQAQYRK